MNISKIKSAVFGITVAAISSSAAWAACTPETVEIQGDWGSVEYTVEIADTAKEQAKGLMFRRTLDVKSGMLFIYETPRRAVFWMKNTLIPLDMIFIDETGEILSVAANARPLDETPIDGGEGIKMILEINGGLAKEIGISVGNTIRHPALDQKTAVWPCNS